MPSGIHNVIVIDKHNRMVEAVKNRLVIFYIHKKPLGERLILLPEVLNQLSAQIQIFVLHIRIIAEYFQGNGAIVTGCL